MGNSSCNWLALFSLQLTIFSFFMLVVGAATESWIKHDTDLGLKLTYTYYARTFTSAGKASYALNILAALSAAFSLLFLVVYFCASQNGSTSKAIKKFKVVVATLSGFGGICGIISCIVFGVTFYVDSPYEPDYSFFLTLIGSIILMIAGAMAYKSKFKVRDPPNQTHPVGIVVNNQGVTYGMQTTAYTANSPQVMMTTGQTWGAGNYAMTQANSTWVTTNNASGTTNPSGYWQNYYYTPPSS
ncbi:hypothetical protein Btru_047190 [Bulinus truncatus]|nr:hypothetical protein Btru_047190 [Bulinus truncatus]